MLQLDAAAIWAVILVIVLFVGDPDIADGIVSALMSLAECKR